MSLANPSARKTVLVVAIPVLAIALLVWLGMHSSDATSAPAVVKSYYTVDDGKTTFVASGDLFPPFTHNGEPAVRAYVFSVDGGKNTWVAYLEQFTPEAKQELERTRKPQRGIEFVAAMDKAIRSGGIQFKRPGDRDWVSATDVAKVARIKNVTPPPGVSGDPIRVFP